MLKTKSDHFKEPFLNLLSKLKFCKSCDNLNFVKVIDKLLSTKFIKLFNLFKYGCNEATEMSTMSF